MHRAITVNAVELLESRTLLSAGDLDVSFGIAGQVLHDLFSATVTHVLGDPAGRLLVAGTDSTGLLMARFTSTGELDSTFGTSGITRLDLGSDELPAGIELTSDGRILLASTFSNDQADNRLAVARLTAAGQLDNTFSVNGVLQTDLTAEPGADLIELQTDGRIIVAGTNQQGYGARRYGVNGWLDSTFGASGFAAVALPQAPSGLAVQSDNRIVLVSASDNAIAVAGLNAGGAVNSAFGTSGVATAPVGENVTVQDVAASPDGALLILARTWSSSTFTTRKVLIRYQADGTLDSAFGSTGMLQTSFNNDSSGRNMLAIQPDGKILLGGTVDDSGIDFAVTRYTAAGTLDSSFGVAGTISTDFDSFSDEPQSLSLMADGKIVLVGDSWNFSTRTRSLAMARYWGTEVQVPPQVIAIDGTDDADTITAVIVGSQIQLGVNGAWQAINPATCTGLYIRGLGGDDAIDLRSVSLPVTILGGAGDDRIYGGDGADLLVGGTGHDLLVGRNGRDKLRGGAGNDTIRGGGGADEIYGDAGNDLLRGGNAADTLLGGTGIDTLRGGGGNDCLLSHDGESDLVSGGPGWDAFENDPDNDSVFSAEEVLA